MTSRDIRTLYQDRFAGEPLIKITGEPPLVKSIAHTHGVEIGGFAVHSSGRRVVICVAIDNLLKGAATQALQNMNLALGFADGILFFFFFLVFFFFFNKKLVFVENAWARRG